MQYNGFSIKVRKSIHEYECAYGAHGLGCSIPKRTHYFIIRMHNLNFNSPKEVKLCLRHTLSEVIKFAEDGRALAYLEKQIIFREQEKKKREREKKKPFNRFNYLDLD